MESHRRLLEESSRTLQHHENQALVSPSFVLVHGANDFGFTKQITEHGLIIARCQTFPESSISDKCSEIVFEFDESDRLVSIQVLRNLADMPAGCVEAPAIQSAVYSCSVIARTFHLTNSFRANLHGREMNAW